MTNVPRLPVLTLVVGLVACQADSLPPQPSPEVASAHTAKASSPTPARRASPPSDAPEAAAEPEDPLDPARVLSDEERRLLEADDATLTPEERVDRAFAQRKLVMADPDHDLRPMLEKLDAQVASGEYAAMAKEMWTGRAAFPADEDEPTPARESSSP